MSAEDRPARTWERAWYLPPKAETVPPAEVGAWFGAMGKWFIKVAPVAFILGWVTGPLF